MNKPVGYILTVYNSKADIYGNRYFSMEVIRTSDNAIGKGTISGGESNCTYSVRKLAESENVEYYSTIQELPIREYNRMVKNWPYIGCTEDQIIPKLKEQFVNSPLAGDN